MMREHGLGGGYATDASVTNAMPVRNYAKYLVWVMVTLLLAPSMLGCSSKSQNQEAQPLVLEWDLSQGHTVKDVGWPTDNHSDWYAREGDTLLTLRLPQNKVFRERIRRFIVDRKGDQVSSINLHLPIMTLGEAYDNAKRLIASWELEAKDIDEWYRNQQSGRPEQHGTFTTFRNDLNPRVGLEILNSFNDAKPWSISVKVTFNQRASASALPPNGDLTVAAANWSAKKSRLISQQTSRRVRDNCKAGRAVLENC